MNKVERLAWHAMSMTESVEIKAEACYILARFFHFNRDYEKAFKVSCICKNFNPCHHRVLVLLSSNYVESSYFRFAPVWPWTSEFEDVWMNIAHVYIALGQYVPALQM